MIKGVQLKSWPCRQYEGAGRRTRNSVAAPVRQNFGHTNIMHHPQTDQARPIQHLYTRCRRAGESPTSTPTTYLSRAKLGEEPACLPACLQPDRRNRTQSILGCVCTTCFEAHHPAAIEGMLAPPPALFCPTFCSSMRSGIYVTTWGPFEGGRTCCLALLRRGKAPVEKWK